MGWQMNQVTPYADMGQNDLEGRLDRNQVSCDRTRASQDRGKGQLWGLLMHSLEVQKINFIVQKSFKI